MMKQSVLLQIFYDLRDICTVLLRSIVSYSDVNSIAFERIFENHKNKIYLGWIRLELYFHETDNPSEYWGRSARRRTEYWNAN